MTLLQAVCMCDVNLYARVWPKITAVFQHSSNRSRYTKYLWIMNTVIFSITMWPPTREQQTDTLCPQQQKGVVVADVCFSVGQAHSKM